MSLEPSPPLAAKRPSQLTHNGHQRTDNWYWLNERENPEVLALLEAENAYCEATLAHLRPLREGLFEEFRSRIQETDLSLPTRKGAWWYYSRTEEGKQYPIHCRKPNNNGVIDDDAAEQILLDENTEAGESDYFALGTFDISPDSNLLAYSTDHEGNELFVIHIRDLRTTTNLDDEIPDAFFGSAWAKDSSELFYVRADGPMRPYQVWRHRLGASTHDDQLVFHEHDDRFFVGVGNSKTDDLVVITCQSKSSTEQRVLRADDPNGEFQIIEPRTENLEYSITHHRNDAGDDSLFILTNADAPNFRLMRTTLAEPSKDSWHEVLAHDEHVRLEHVEAFADFLVVSERRDANAQFGIYDLATGRYSPVSQPEEAFTADVAANPEYNSNVIRFSYTSLVTPSSIYELDVKTGQRERKKQQPVLGDFDASRYETRRLWAIASDGEQVPISLVQHKRRKSILGSDSPGGPLLLWGYGAYEISSDPYFSSLRLSLLDRGFAFAIAHIRGGGELGRRWYEQGRRNEKPNSFRDFITCAEYLIRENYTTTEQLVIRGGSAGGLLMGAVVNMRPDLFGAVVAEVPFVDTLTTMCDPSMPLTTHEYDEWGDPNDDAIYRLIASYSPVDNVAHAAYPPMFVTAGFNDPLVGYQEPAKWVQKLRERKTDNNDVLLKVELGAGHQGLSGRYDAWRDEAYVYAYIFHALGMDIAIN